MPRLHFSITSLPPQLFKMLTEGYHHPTVEEIPRGAVRFFVYKLKRWGSTLRHALKQATQTRSFFSVEKSKEHYRAVYPMFDPQFLLFAVLVAEHVNKGFEIGNQDGRGAFAAFDDFNFSRDPPDIFMVTETQGLRIVPHRYYADVGDIPEHALLKKLQQMTRDKSLSALVNRLSLWMYLFVGATYYGWPIAAKHKQTKELKMLTSPFFKKFSKSMSL